MYMPTQVGRKILDAMYHNGAKLSMVGTRAPIFAELLDGLFRRVNLRTFDKLLDDGWVEPAGSKGARFDYRLSGQAIDHLYNGKEPQAKNDE